MPPILLVRGWRLFFYSNEGKEPYMSTLKRRSANASTGFSPGQIEEAWSYNLSPALRRELRKIIFEHFDLICEEWERRREA